MYLAIHPLNPHQRNINIATAALEDGGVIIYPTDTIYGLGCDIYQPKAVQRICRIKNIDPEKAQLSFVCYDISDMSRYIKSVPTSIYRLLRNHLPGPYTFILAASKEVPKLLKSKRDTVGLRIPDNLIARTIVKQLGRPLLSTSLPGDMVEEYTDPELINQRFGSIVDVVIDGGPGGMKPSTIIDCTGDEPVVVRKGLGEWQGVH